MFRVLQIVDTLWPFGSASCPCRRLSRDAKVRHKAQRQRGAADYYPAGRPVTAHERRFTDGLPDGSPPAFRLFVRKCHGFPGGERLVRPSSDYRSHCNRLGPNGNNFWGLKCRRCMVGLAMGSPPTGGRICLRLLWLTCPADAPGRPDERQVKREAETAFGSPLRLSPVAPLLIVLPTI